MKTLLLLLVIALSFVAASGQPATNPPGPKDGRDADREAIKTEIGRITQAFIDQDIETVYKTHSQDWSGFLNDGQTVPIYGIDDYMKANGIPWPPPPGYKPKPDPNRHYTITNYLCNFVATDIGVASFTLDFPWQDAVHFNRLRIMDVFRKQNGTWVQAASYTVLDAAWKQQQADQPVALNNAQKKRILDLRESVWRAWFAGDTTKLADMIPDEAVAINGSNPTFDNRQVILDGAKKFADGGGKLTRLEFPRTEFQAYGNTIILWTSYSYDIEQGGKKNTVIGNGVETFVRRDGKLVNTGWILADK